MNEDYWKKFYTEEHEKSPSQFAKMCLDFLEPKKAIIDVGCGNGRDSYFFAKRGWTVIGIDPANKPKEVKNATFLQQDYKEVPFNYNQVYARFFLHAIENLDIAQFIQKCGSLVMLEFRNIGDVPTAFKGHKRTAIDSRDVMSTLIDNNFVIEYSQLSYGLAVYQKENPYICRIIARKRL
jgi:tellurite methyltransferase